LPGGFHHLHVKIEAGRLPAPHAFTRSHMVSCADGLFIAL